MSLLFGCIDLKEKKQTLHDFFLPVSLLVVTHPPTPTKLEFCLYMNIRICNNHYFVLFWLSNIAYESSVPRLCRTLAMMRKGHGAVICAGNCFHTLPVCTHGWLHIPLFHRHVWHILKCSYFTVLIKTNSSNLYSALTYFLFDCA